MLICYNLEKVYQLNWKRSIITMRKMLYFDVEWANSKNKSICQLGLLSQDFDTGDPIYPELNIYVNPQDKFDNICISVHNITKAKVKDCKPFNIIWKDINKYFGDNLFLGYFFIKIVKYRFY